MTLSQTIKTYIKLTKPGILFGNAITATAGFLLASKERFFPWLFLATLIGLSCIIASACVFNNYIDRDADQKMTRTQNRPLVKGEISVRKALTFGSLLGLCGASLLGLYTNLLVLFVACFGFFIYVVVYAISKYRTTYGTVIGSIAGAVPPVVGYCAVSHQFDMAAFLLFLIVSLWQMPHFFAIAMYRLDDYAAASIPVLPLKKGLLVTKIHMLFYVMAFTAATTMLTVFGYTGYAYLIVASLLGLAWLWLSIKGFRTDNDKQWARKMFILSLQVITVLCLMISVDRG